MTIDNAVYAKGHRTADPRNLQETYEVLRDRGELAWIGLYRPDAEIRSVATEFEWHELPVQEAISAHQRPSWSVRSDALTVNAAAVVGQRQNEEMRTFDRGQSGAERGGQTDLRLGGHPVRATLIGTIYGMNFDSMPELHGRWGTRWRCSS